MPWWRPTPKSRRRRSKSRREEKRKEEETRGGDKTREERNEEEPPAPSQAARASQWHDSRPTGKEQAKRLRCARKKIPGEWCSADGAFEAPARAVGRVVGKADGRDQGGRRCDGLSLLKKDGERNKIEW